MKTKLIISISLEDESEDSIREIANNILSRFYGENVEIVEQVKCTLIREGDRSALNLLLPKIEGRLGEHYQGRKADLKEIVSE